jgi:hypothetical protein
MEVKSEAFCGRVESRRQSGTRPPGKIGPRRPRPVLSPVRGKARGQAGPCPGGEGPPPGEPPEEPGGPPEEGGSSAREAAASGFGGPDLRVVRPAVVVEDAKKRASIALFRDSSARRRAGLISPGRRRESVSIPPWGFPGRFGRSIAWPPLPGEGGEIPPGTVMVCPVDPGHYRRRLQLRGQRLRCPEHKVD